MSNYDQYMKDRMAASMDRYLAWHRENGPRLAAEEEAARVARNAEATRRREKAKHRREKKEARDAWREGVRKILAECRRREAARSYCDTYDQSVEHLNTHLNGASL